MAKKVVFTSKTLPRIKDTSKALRRVNPDKVAEALEAEKSYRII